MKKSRLFLLVFICLSFLTFGDEPNPNVEKYQYFTEANMNKLKEAGYTKEFYSLEEGVKDYVENYLSKEDRYL